MGFLSRCFHAAQWTLAVCPPHRLMWLEAWWWGSESHSGLNLREPHQCRCGSVVNARALHSFVCKRARAGQQGHHALNDLVACSFAAVGGLVTKEPAGLSRTDGEQQEGLTLVPWQNGKSLCWDVTVICSLAESYVNRAAREAGAAAEVAASRKNEKYAELDSRYLFEPIAVETLSVLNSSANSVLKEIGNKISLNTAESREVSFLHQCISVLVQRFNAILLHNSLPTIDCVDWISYLQLFSNSYFLTCLGIEYWGIMMPCDTLSWSLFLLNLISMPAAWCWWAKK